MTRSLLVKIFTAPAKAKRARIIAAMKGIKS